MEVGSNLEVNAPKSGGGEEGKAEKGLSHPQSSPVSLTPAAVPRILEYPTKIQVPRASGGEVGLLQGDSSHLLPSVPHSRVSCFWVTPSHLRIFTACVVYLPVHLWVL